MAVDNSIVDEFMDDWLLNEKKIVNCKLLSRRLSMPVLVAQKHLERYQKNWNRQDKMLSVVYYVSGRVKKNGTAAYKASLVRADDLEGVKKHFTNVSSCHVFSLQCGEAKDAVSVLFTDGLDDENEDDLETISIRFPAARLRDTSKVVSAQSCTDKGSKVEEKPGTKVAETSKIESHVQQISQSDANPAKQVQNAPVSKPVKNGGALAAAFAKAKPTMSKPAETEKLDANVKKIATETDKTPVETEKSISKSMDKEKNTNSSTEVTSLASQKSDLFTAESDSSPETSPVKQQPRKRAAENGKDFRADSPPVSKKISNGKTSKRAQEKTKNSKTVQKKRKELPIFDDDDEEEEKIIPSTQQAEKATENSQEIKRQKKVSKTFVDEDGYIVTKTVMEPEVVSTTAKLEAESKKESSPQKPILEKNEKKSSVGPKKQATLTNFLFKRN